MKIKGASILIAILAMVGCMATAWRGNAIRDRLAETSGLGAHDISIDERAGGIIVLSGNVSSGRDRDTIEKVARKTRGVTEVTNHLVVASSSVAVREGSRAFSDDEAQVRVSEIMERMRSSSEIRDYNLRVEVVGDTVTLRGEVGNEQERAAAERIALNTRGVNRVKNEILLAHSTRGDVQISDDVRDVLLKTKDIDLRNVEITTRDGVVTFRGSQSSHRDIDHLLSAALMVDGVRDIRNELTVNGRRYSEGYRRTR